MSIFSELAAKPWTVAQAEKDDGYDGVTFEISKTTLGFRVFLTVISVFFLLLYVAYSARAQFATWIAVPGLSLLWANTGILILCSLTFAYAQRAAASGDIRKLQNSLLLSGILSFSFLIGQALVWNALVNLKYFASANPINAFFYLFTGIHGLHLLGGLVAWGRVTIKSYRDEDISRLSEVTRLCAHYWHFLLLVWLIIFLSVPQYLTLFPEEGWQAWCSLI